MQELGCHVIYLNLCHFKFICYSSCCLDTSNERWRFNNYLIKPYLEFILIIIQIIFESIYVILHRTEGLKKFTCSIGLRKTHFGKRWVNHIGVFLFLTFSCIIDSFTMADNSEEVGWALDIIILMFNLNTFHFCFENNVFNIYL